jgi:hypothetical protein
LVILVSSLNFLGFIEVVAVIELEHILELLGIVHLDEFFADMSAEGSQLLLRELSEMLVDGVGEIGSRGGQHSVGQLGFLSVV